MSVIRQVEAAELEAAQPLAFYGTPLKPKPRTARVALPLHTLRVGRKGAVYELEIAVSPLTADKAVEAIEKLREGMKEKFGITTFYATAFRDRIFLQIRGSPFSWVALLAWLPLILGLIGIVMLGISVWQIIVEVPTWIWAMLVIGGLTFLIGPTIGRWIIEEAEKARR